MTMLSDVKDALTKLGQDFVRLNDTHEDLKGQHHELIVRTSEVKVEYKRALDLAETWEQRALEAESKEVGLKKANDDLLVTNVTLETERNALKAELLLAQNEAAHWKDRYGSIAQGVDTELMTWREFGRALRKRLDQLPA